MNRNRNMNLDDHIRSIFAASIQVKQMAAGKLVPVIAAAADIMTDALRTDGRIFSCGNGGSAADAQHFAAEMVNRFELDRPALPAMALTTDSSALTSIANDYGYEEIFAKQLSALAREGDVLLAISTSGNSANVLRAVTTGHRLGLRVVALTGQDGGALGRLCTDDDVQVCVPSDSTARIQEVHLLVIHCLCSVIDRRLLGMGF